MLLTGITLEGRLRLVVLAPGHVSEGSLEPLSVPLQTEQGTASLG